MAGYRQALTRFEAAVRADAWKGSQHPGDHASIERELEEARRALVAKLQYRQLSAEQRKTK